MNHKFCGFTVIVFMLFGLAVVSQSDAQSVSPPNKATAKQMEIEYLKRVRHFEAELKELNLSVKDAVKEESELKQKRELLLSKQDELGISKESFIDLIKQLQTSRVEMLIDLAGLEARRDTILKLRKETAQQRTGSVEGKLLDLLAFEEKDLERTEKLFKTGVVPESALQTIRKKILELKIRLAEARPSVAMDDPLNEQLLTTSLERAEKKARLEQTESLLADMTKARKTLAEIEQVNAEIGAITRNIGSMGRIIQNKQESIEKGMQRISELKNLSSGSDDQ